MELHDQMEQNLGVKALDNSEVNIGSTENLSFLNIPSSIEFGVSDSVLQSIILGEMNYI